MAGADFLVLAAGVQLHRAEAASTGSQLALSSGPGCVPLNPPAARLLALCDGSRTRDEVLAAARLPSPLADAAAFLDVALAQRWIELRR